MNRLITRPLLMLCASGVALAVAVAPVKVSAAEVDATCGGATAGFTIANAVL